MKTLAVVPRPTPGHALPILLFAALVTTSSLAADREAVVGMGADVILLPPGPVEASGEPQRLVFIAVDEHGRPPRDISFRGTTVEGGTLEAWTEHGPGVYSAELTLPPTVEAGTAEVHIKARVGGSAVERTTAIQVVRALKVELTFDAEPSLLVLGQDDVAALTVQATDGAGRPVDGLDLVLDASMGRIIGVEPLGEGRYRVDYRPPPRDRPAMAIISAVDRADPLQSYAFFQLPLVAQVTWPVKTGEPGLLGAVEIRGERFGPVEAGEDGVARVPILVPPGERSGTAVVLRPAEDAGAGPAEVRRADIDLKTPDAKRLEAAATVEAFPGDGVSILHLNVLALDERALPDDEARLALFAEHGHFGAVRPLGGGVHQVEYLPPVVDGPTREKVSVALQGSEKMGVDYVRFELFPGLPATISLSTEPAVIDFGRHKVTLTAVIDSGGVRPPEGTRVALYGGDGAILTEAVGDGVTFRGTFEDTFDDPTPVAADVVIAPPGDHRQAAYLLPWPVSYTAAVGDPMTVVVLAVDGEGVPVPGVVIEARSMSWHGEVEPSLTTDESGRAEFHLTGGKARGLVPIHFRAGDINAVCPLLQVETPQTAYTVPTYGGAGLRKAMDRWSSLRAHWFLGKGSPPPPDAPPPPPTLAAHQAAASAATGPASYRPWWLDDGGDGDAPDLPPEADEWVIDIKQRLAGDEIERESLYRVELVPSEGGGYDIVVQYSHGSTTHKKGGDTVSYTVEEWFAEWAGRIGKLARGRDFVPRDFWLVNMDDGKYLVLSLDDCRRIGGMNGAKKLQFIADHARRN